MQVISNQRVSNWGQTLIIRWILSISLLIGNPPILTCPDVAGYNPVKIEIVVVFPIFSQRINKKIIIKIPIQKLKAKSGEGRREKGGRGKGRWEKGVESEEGERS